MCPQCANFSLKWHLFLNHFSKYKILSHECSPYCPLPKLHKWIRSANKRDARALDKKSLKWHLLKHWSKEKNDFTELFMIPSTKTAQMVPLRWTKGSPDKHIEKCHLGRLIVGYTNRNHVWLLRFNIAVKQHFWPSILWDTSPKANFKYSYPIVQ